MTLPRSKGNTENNPKQDGAIALRAQFHAKASNHAVFRVSGPDQLIRNLHVYSVDYGVDWLYTACTITDWTGGVKVHAVEGKMNGVIGRRGSGSCIPCPNHCTPVAWRSIEILHCVQRCGWVGDGGFDAVPQPWSPHPAEGGANCRAALRRPSPNSGRGWRGASLARLSGPLRAESIDPRRESTSACAGGGRARGRRECLPPSRSGGGRRGKAAR